MRTLRLGGLLAFFALWLATAAWAEVAVPPLKARVTDLTNTLSASQRSELENELQGIETRTGSQVAVLLVPTTQPEAIEQYSIRVVEAWKLGKKGVDNGLLILVAKNDHKVRIEVGYGLEGTIPDVIAKRIIDETITPRFKQGDFAGGLMAGVKRIAGVIEERPATETPSSSEPPQIGPGGVPSGSLGRQVTDLTDTLSEDQLYALEKDLSAFYDASRGKMIFVVVVPSSRPETAAQLGAQILKFWGEKDNLDVARTVLLLVSKDDGAVHIEAGDDMKDMVSAKAFGRATDAVQTTLRKQGLAPAVQTGVRELEKEIQEAAKWDLGERLRYAVIDFPIWLLVALIAVGTGLRWFLGPFFGGVTMGGLVGGGVWWVSGTIGAAIFAAVLAFVFVLVGIANWISIAASGSSGSSGGGGFGGGFSGGGGSFGGGGASGSW